MLNLLFAALASLAAALCAGENPGVTAVPLLQEPVGAKAVGLGTAFSAVASDVSILHYNPAGLSNLDHREASAMYLGGRVDQNVEYAAIGGPLPFGGLSGSGYAAGGASLLLSQNGRINVNRTNADGSFAGSQSLDAGGDMVATFGYSERVGFNDWEGVDSNARFHHFAGLSGKFIRSTLAPSYEAHAFAADMGYFMRSPELGVSAAASLLNLGGKMRFISEGDPLPLTLRAATAYHRKLPGPTEHGLLSALEWDYNYYERRWSAAAGLEYQWLESWATRVGYQFRRGLAGLTVGFGVRWGAVVLDYAWAMSRHLGDMHRFSFGFRFGRVPLKEREKGRRRVIESVPEHEPLKGLEQRKPEPPEMPRREFKMERSDGVPDWIY